MKNLAFLTFVSFIGFGSCRTNFSDFLGQDFEPPKTCGPSDLIIKFVDSSLLMISDLYSVTHNSVPCQKAAYAATAMRATFRQLPECQMQMVCEVENQIRSSLRSFVRAFVAYWISEETGAWVHDNLVILAETACDDSACARYDEVYARHPLVKKISEMSDNRRYIRKEVDEALEACGADKSEQSFLHAIWAGITMARRFGGIVSYCINETFF